MALGEQIMLDKAGPQFTYEIRWESDMSTSIIRPNEVAVRVVRPALRCPLLLLLYLSTPVAWHVDVVTSRTQPHTATWPERALWRVFCAFVCSYGSDGRRF
jgi:hypothetical protein